MPWCRALDILMLVPDIVLVFKVPQDGLMDAGQGCTTELGGNQN